MTFVYLGVGPTCHITVKNTLESFHFDARLSGIKANSLNRFSSRVLQRSLAMKKFAFFFVFIFSTLARASRAVSFENDVADPLKDGSDDLRDTVQKSYRSEGCYKLGKGKTGAFLGNFKQSKNPVDKCAQLAETRGFAEFALLRGGECRGGDNLEQAYMTYGTSTACRYGVGAVNAANVYTIIRAQCSIESFDKATKQCQKQRQDETAATRILYELGPPGVSYPLPSLNKNRTVVYGMLKRDPLENHWVDLYIKSTIKKNQNIFGLFYMITIGKEFETEGEYVKAYNFFVARQRTMVSRPEDRKHFRFHFEDPSIPFKNISDLAHWRSDEVFTDQRLAGANPMAIQRVSWDPETDGGVNWAELSDKLNPSFDWEGAVQDVMGSDIALSQAISQGYVYVVHYPLYTGLPAITNDRFGQLMDAFSPIAIFVSKPFRQQRANRLKPVAIQLNSSTESPVFTPEDGEHWVMAKHVLQAADFAQLQIVEHLYKVHLFMEPVCVCMQRHLSKLHPLHQLLKHHCRGLLGTNKFGYPVLMAPSNGTLDKLLTVGRHGAVEMMLRAHEVVSWDDTDFLSNIKKRGLDDKEKLPYFPYRDDGKLIHAAIINMVNEYVDKYYKSHHEVQADLELQNFANDASADGGKNQVSGTGRVKNFPAKISSKWILKKHLTRFIWMTSAQHSAVNYGSSFMTALTPNMPSKLYNDSRVAHDHYGVYNLPRWFTCGAQAALSMTLGSMHYDSLFDFANSLQDKKGSSVIQKYHSYLQNYVKSTIQQRNLERVGEGYLPYPYLVPGWIANSIHT